MRLLPSPLNWARRLPGGGVTAAVTVTSSSAPRTLAYARERLPRLRQKWHAHRIGKQEENRFI